jgi:CheY-like chemotaxis protein
MVVLSAAREASDVADELGAQAFLPKPFELDAILSVVGQVVEPGARR